MFNECKVAQMAAFFLIKRGGWMSHLKLMKLLYLADREAMKRHGAPISGDKFVSLQHGPVLSQTLNLMDGDVESSPNGWEAWITGKENHELSLNRTSARRDDLDELSDADMEVLESVWADFGMMDRWAIRDYTHTSCPEWKDPNGSSIPINNKDIFIAIGRNADEAERLAEQIEKERAIDKLFSSL
ncbi:MAG: SocA family protein [Nitrospinae bacterium]|nr:SocA family protein [Nitrospinota bacterium]